MSKFYYLDDDTKNPQPERYRRRSEYLSAAELFKKTGVEYFKLDITTYKTDGFIDKMKKDRGYTYEDEMVCSQEFLEKYYTEHLHADEEIRLVTVGSGYFEVRDVDDRWVRLALEVGDLVILPSGIYHRFTYDNNNYIAMRRYFRSEPVWTSFNRPAEDMDCRKEYVEKLRKGFAAASPLLPDA